MSAHPPLVSRRELLGLLAAGARFGVGGQRVAAPTARPLVRSILKDITPDALGDRATLFHEHLSWEWARVSPPPPNGTARPGPPKDATAILEQLDTASSEGVGCIVDAGTTDVGRDLSFLKTIAGRTSVHIVACGGYYMQRTYPPDFAAKSEDQIADDLVGEAAASGHGAFGEIGERSE